MNSSAENLSLFDDADEGNLAIRRGDKWFALVPMQDESQEESVDDSQADEAKEGDLTRIGITIPKTVYGMIGDAQYVLQKSWRRISVSAFFEAAVMEFLAKGSEGILFAAQRHGGSLRRGGRRK